MSLEALGSIFQAPGMDAAAFRAHWSAEEWAELEADAALMAAARLALEFAAQRRGGIAPAHYTATTTCARCGPVPVWPGAPARVLGCPWCAAGGGHDR